MRNERFSAPNYRECRDEGTGGIEGEGSVRRLSLLPRGTGCGVGLGVKGATSRIGQDAQSPQHAPFHPFVPVVLSVTVDLIAAVPIRLREEAWIRNWTTV